MDSSTAVPIIKGIYTAAQWYVSPLVSDEEEPQDFTELLFEYRPIPSDDPEVQATEVPFWENEVHIQYLVHMIGSFCAEYIPYKNNYLTDHKLFDFLD